MIGLTPDERTRLAEWMVRDLGPQCPQWLTRQRWFGSKARPVAGAAVADVIWLGGDSSAALVLLDVSYSDGGDAVERYALVAGPEQVATPASIAAVPGTSWLLSEVAARPAVAADMLGAMRRRARLPGTRGGELICESMLNGPSEPHQIRPIGQEQSNTSIDIDGRHVLKVIRRLQAGEHPQLEIGAFLRHTDFSQAPPLQGSMIYRAADDDYAVGILEGWVDNVGDGWRYVTAALEQATNGGARAALLESLSALGRVTADFHIAMASDAAHPAFAPEPASSADRREWVERLTRDAMRVVDVLSHGRAGLSESARDLGGAVVAGGSALQQRIASIDVDRVRGPLMKIRVHGDYHLGQTLKTPGGFVLIDFEGEPARPLAERRAKHCALKDVAGMLRSLEYADAAVRLRHASAPDAAEAMRQAFLAGYYSRPHLRSFLPDPQSGGPLLMLFELDKVLYEVEYELNNRPEWLPIPLAALARISEAAA